MGKSPGKSDFDREKDWRRVSLYHLRVLMRHFAPGSMEYYGDLGRVQVALRKDSNPREAKRVKGLAQQVFLLDSQKMSEEQDDALSRGSRSIVLLIHPVVGDPLHSRLLDPEDPQKEIVIRLPFRDVVIGLLSQQLQLQLLAAVLLSGTELVVGGISSLLLRQILAAGRAPAGPTPTWSLQPKLPGLMSALSGPQLSSLLLCVEAAFQIGLEFDQRPGLKFLLQRVFNSTVAANLYKQTSTAWALRTLVLLEMGRRAELTEEGTKSLCRSAEQSSGVVIPPSFPSPTSLGSGLRLLSEGYWRLCQELKRIELTCADRKEMEKVHIEAPPIVFLLASDDGSSSEGRLLEEVTGSPLKARKESKEENESDPEEEATESPAHSAPSVQSNGDPTADSEEEEEVAEPVERVYKVVTNDDVNKVLKEYKRRKLQAAMPPRVVTPPPATGTPAAEATEEAGDATLRSEQETSGLRDEEARALAWTEMGVGVAALVVGAEKESEFRRLLPAVFPSAVLLAESSTQPRIRSAIADLLQRLNAVYKFAE